MEIGKVRMTIAQYTADTSKPLWVCVIPQSLSIDVNIDVTTILSI
jgi:hypothetical protein